MWKGIFDSIAVPDTLTAQVVTPGEDPRIHGYRVNPELVRQASFVDVGWLALTGELPTSGERAALEAALILLSPLHVGEGPTHAGILARVAGAVEEVLPPILAAALGQHTAEEVAVFTPLFAWLDGSGSVPAAALISSPSDEDQAAYAALSECTRTWLGSPLPTEGVLTRVATAYALLHRLGVADPLRLQAFSLWARLPVLFAEAACTRSGAVMTYPARLPDYRYVETTP